jgi:nucleoside-diphosphate-sugar epimerase
MPVALVTGANGFIGSNLSKTLIERGWKVKGLVLTGTPIDFLDGLDVEIHEGDVRRPHSLSKALKNVDVVFHLAAVAKDWGPAELFFSVNVEGTGNLLEASVKGGATRFLLMSSVAVHRYGGHYGAAENTPRDCPDDFPYGRSKVLAEDRVRAFHERGDIEGVIVRPGIFPFGPHDTTSFYRLAGALETGRFAFVDGGRARISTAYVENLCHGVELAGRQPRAAGETYIIADDVTISWRGLMERFCRELGVRPPRLSVPYPVAHGLARLLETLWTTLPLKGEPPVTEYRARLMHRDLHFVSRKAREALGYVPPVPLDKGIRRSVAWYRRARGRYG